MFDHIGLRVKDLKAASRLYEAMLAPLGHVAGSSGDSYAGFGPKDKPALWLHLDNRTAGAHVALVHSAGVANSTTSGFWAGSRASAMLVECSAQAGVLLQMCEVSPFTSRVVGETERGAGSS